MMYFLMDDDMCITMQSLLHLTFSAMLKVALPRHEGPHSSGCQRGRVHPEQTAGRGRPQTRRLRGINCAVLFLHLKLNVKVGPRVKLLAKYCTKESLINSE